MQALFAAFLHWYRRYFIGKRWSYAHTKDRFVMRRYDPELRKVLYRECAPKEERDAFDDWAIK